MVINILLSINYLILLGSFDKSIKNPCLQGRLMKDIEINEQKKSQIL